MTSCSRQSMACFRKTYRVLFEYTDNCAFSGAAFLLHLLLFEVYCQRYSLSYQRLCFVVSICCSFWFIYLLAKYHTHTQLRSALPWVRRALTCDWSCSVSETELCRMSISFSPSLWWTRQTSMPSVRTSMSDASGLPPWYNPRVMYNRLHVRKL